MNSVNSKDRRIILILVVGIILAVIAAVCVYFYLTPKRSTIYTFNEDYAAGTILTEDMVTPVKCDDTVLVGGRSDEASSVFVVGDELTYIILDGEALRMDVTEGMPLTTSMLSVSGGSTIEMAMDPTKVAISIPVTETQGVSNELKEGSRVNIYFTGGDTEGTTLLLQGMRILAIARDDDGGMEAVTIECTTDESLQLVYAEEYGDLYLGLVDTASYQYATGQPSYAPAAATE